MKHESKNTVIFTIGHSTRSLDEFIELLLANGLSILVDVRTIPKSRHNPQFNSDVLAKALASSGIGYVGMKALGGLRHPRPDSMNLGWRNASFRGYADHMQTVEFALNLEKLVAAAAKEPTALMCAEAVPWRCHRSLIADALAIRGIEVLHIIGKRTPKRHILTLFAKVQDGMLSYPEPVP
jgi:uncharacterized protein (DUF488 family)